MTIQWFPGHMAKARRQVSENLKLVDIVFELVDARLPLSSRNPMIDEVIHQKPRLLILNKQDMADETETRRWIQYFADKGFKAVAINSFEGKGLQAVIKGAQEILAEKWDRMKAKSMKPRAIRAMIVGIPNVGKSTLINRLAKKNLAKTGNMPGVTKSQQWIKVAKDIELLDTPGILWPKFEDQRIGLLLALIGSINDDVLQMEELALELIIILKQFYPQFLIQRYEITDLEKEPLEILKEIATVRKCFLKGEELDYRKAAALLMDDFRSGRIGKITLERPEALDE